MCSEEGKTVFIEKSLQSSAAIYNPQHSNCASKRVWTYEASRRCQSL
uniref:Uncharacterized protein n=1 Tax=Anopheles minimus TaxID=112268 RepID=A0A182WQ81_9DIPT